MINNSAKIISHSTYLDLSIVEQVALDFTMTKQKIFTFANGSPDSSVYLTYTIAPSLPMDYLFPVSAGSL